MTLPIEIANLDATIVHLIFESLTEREFLPELGAYASDTLRQHLAILVEHGYVVGDISHTCDDPRNVRARSLTINGYMLLSRMNSERRKESQFNFPLPRRYYGGWALGV